MDQLQAAVPASAEAEKGARPRGGSPEARLRDESEELARDTTPLVCVRCRRPITTAGERIAVDGLHEHTQINPHGYIWNFGCFAHAPGCVTVGAPSREFAWFPGHAWQIEDCSGCRLHLGWLFVGPDRRFHGLIVGRVVEDDADRDAPRH
ncbi:MAG TPA: cereblon family protein [Kofleriaceae bacterium]|nr:cereblon family protein [Kofleriaceae bacterium]